MENVQKDVVEKQPDVKEKKDSSAKAATGKTASGQHQDQSRKEQADKKRKDRELRLQAKQDRHQRKIRQVTEDMSTEVIAVNTHETSAFAQLASQADISVAKIRKMMGLGNLDFVKAAQALKEEQDLMLAFHELTKKLCRLADITYRVPWLVRQLQEAKDKEARREAQGKVAAEKLGVSAELHLDEEVPAEAREALEEPQVVNA